MRIILQQDVKGQGKKGQMIDVSDGYARNYLLPRKLAVEATNDNINIMNQAIAAQKRKTDLEMQAANEIRSQLQDVSVVIEAKGGTSGKIFGAVTSKEISENLMKQHGIDINKNKMVMDGHIKNFGTYNVKVKLCADILGEIKVDVRKE